MQYTKTYNLEYLVPIYLTKMAWRKHIHIVEFGLTLLTLAEMPLHYWWEAFSTAVYLIKKLPTPVTQNESY